MQCENMPLFQHITVGEIYREANESLIANSRQEKSGSSKSRCAGEDGRENKKIKQTWEEAIQRWILQCDNSHWQRQ